MVRKKSGKKVGKNFCNDLAKIMNFLDDIDAKKLTDQHKTWAYEAALIKVHAALENLILEYLITAVNNDTETISSKVGISFPRHLSRAVCEYLIIQDGYFSFSGDTSGLIKSIKEFIPAGHPILGPFMDKKYRRSLDRLIALRNFAAHESRKSRKIALKATGYHNMKSAGAWLKSRNHARELIESLTELGTDLQKVSPY
jgi:hypothetical protein